MSEKDGPEDKKPFRKVRITAASWVALAEILEGFDKLEYDAWDDKGLGCVVCELHIPNRKGVWRHD